MDNTEKRGRGRPKKLGDVKMLAVRIPDVLHARATTEAAKHKDGLAGLVATALRNLLDGEPVAKTPEPKVDYAGHPTPEPVSVSNLPPSPAGYGKDVGAFLVAAKVPIIENPEPEMPVTPTKATRSWREDVAKIQRLLGQDNAAEAAEEWMYLCSTRGVKGTLAQLWMASGNAKTINLKILELDQKHPIFA